MRRIFVVEARLSTQHAWRVGDAYTAKYMAKDDAAGLARWNGPENVRVVEYRPVEEEG